MEIMKSKLFKGLCTFAAVTMAAAGLAGCSGKGQQDTKPTVQKEDTGQKEIQESEGQKQGQETEKEKKDTAGGDKITITFQRQSAVKAGMQERIDAFNASQDEIEVKLIATTDHVQNMQKLQLSTASGQAPNIVAVNYIDVENAA